MAKIERTIDCGSADHLRWVPSLGEVHFFAHFGGNRLLCRVSRDYLEAANDRPRSHEACVATARAHFDRIRRRAAYLVSIGRYEEGGSVLLTAEDW